MEVTEDIIDTTNTVEGDKKSLNSNERFEVDDHIATMYDGHGRITYFDEVDYEVEFMESKKQFFQWPGQKDSLWMDKASFICKTAAVEATESTN